MPRDVPNDDCGDGARADARRLIAAIAARGVAGRFGDLLSLTRNVVPLFDLDAPQAILIQFERDAETGEMRMLPWSTVPVVDHRIPSPDGKR